MRKKRNRSFTGQHLIDLWINSVIANSKEKLLYNCFEMLCMDQTTSTVLHSALKRTLYNNTFSTPIDYRNFLQITVKSRNHFMQKSKEIDEEKKEERKGVKD